MAHLTKTALTGNEILPIAYDPAGSGAPGVSTKEIAQLQLFDIPVNTKTPVGRDHLGNIVYCHKYDVTTALVTLLPSSPSGSGIQTGYETANGAGSVGELINILKVESSVFTPILGGSHGANDAYIQESKIKIYLEDSFGGTPAVEQIYFVNELENDYTGYTGFIWLYFTEVV